MRVLSGRGFDVAFACSELQTGAVGLALNALTAPFDWHSQVRK